MKKLYSKYGVSADTLEQSDVSKTKANASFFGFAEGNLVDGSLVFTNFVACVGAEMTISYTVPVASGVYLGLAGGGEIKLEFFLERGLADKSIPLEPGAKISLTPWLKAYAGLGKEGLLSGEIYGKGTMPMSATFKNSGELSLSIKGEFGYEADVLFWHTGEKVLVDGTVGPFVTYWGNSKVKQSRMLTSNSLKVAEEDNNLDLTLTERVEPSSWLGENNASTSKSRKARAVTAEQLSFTTLQNNIYARSETKIITAGDTTLAVWTSEDSGRDEYNRLKLVYSVYNSANDTWSEPKAVCDDGYIDASPALATDGENIYVTWQKYCKTYTAENSTDLTSVLSAAEIYLAKYDAINDTFVNAERLTDNEVYDYSPSVTVVDGNPVVFYATNPANVIMSATGNIISKYENGTTSVINSNIANVQNLTSANVNGSAQCAYAVDTDGNLETTNDIAVFYGLDSFTQFDKFYDNESVSNLVYADWNGTTTLFVSDDVNIYYEKDGVATSILEEETIISNHIQAVNEDGELSFYWLSANENGNGLYTVGEVDGEWTSPISLIDRENSLSNLALTYANHQVLGFVNETTDTDTNTNRRFSEYNYRKTYKF